MLSHAVMELICLGRSHFSKHVLIVLPKITSQNAMSSGPWVYLLIGRFAVCKWSVVCKTLANCCRFLHVIMTSLFESFSFCERRSRFGKIWAVRHNSFVTSRVWGIKSIFPRRTNETMSIVMLRGNFDCSTLFRNRVRLARKSSVLSFRHRSQVYWLPRNCACSRPSTFASPTQICPQQPQQCLPVANPDIANVALQMARSSPTVQFGQLLYPEMRINNQSMHRPFGSKC